MNKNQMCRLTSKIPTILLSHRYHSLCPSLNSLKFKLIMHGILKCELCRDLRNSNHFSLSLKKNSFQVLTSFIGQMMMRKLKVTKPSRHLLNNQPWNQDLKLPFTQPTTSRLKKQMNGHPNLQGKVPQETYSFQSISKLTKSSSKTRRKIWK